MKKPSKRKTALTREQVIALLKKEMPGLKDKYGVEKIILFGSYAKGTQKSKSDVDLLVDIRKPIGFGFVSLVEHLEEILGRKVDVATLEHFKESLRNPRYKPIAEDIKKSMIYV